MKAETTATNGPQLHHARLWMVVAAFAAIYLIWGSTYLAIRYAVESIPPFLMAGSRQLVVGFAIFTFSRWRGAPAPSRAEWRDGAIAGILMLVIGNGGVTWAEQRVPSSVAALLVALTPLWMVLLDWMRRGGARPRPLVAVGLVIGIAGVALLTRGHGEHHKPIYGWSVAAILTGSIGWSYGSLFNRSARKPSSPFLAVSLQMITGGTALLALAAAQGEFGHFTLSHVTTRSLCSWLYLMIAGSLIAYTAYVWLLHASTPARVATYAYVNPFIAVLLGCTLGRETFTHELMMAGLLIIVAVVFIVGGGAKTPTKSAPQLKTETPAMPVSE